MTYMFVFPACPPCGGVVGRIRPPVARSPALEDSPRDRRDRGSQRARVAVTAVTAMSTVTAVFRRDQLMSGLVSSMCVFNIRI